MHSTKQNDLLTLKYYESLLDHWRHIILSLQSQSDKSTMHANSPHQPELKKPTMHDNLPTSGRCPAAQNWLRSAIQRYEPKMSPEDREAAVQRWVFPVKHLREVPDDEILSFYGTSLGVEIILARAQSLHFESVYHSMLRMVDQIELPPASIAQISMLVDTVEMLYLHTPASEDNMDLLFQTCDFLYEQRARNPRQDMVEQIRREQERRGPLCDYCAADFPVIGDKDEGSSGCTTKVAESAKSEGELQGPSPEMGESGIDTYLKIIAYSSFLKVAAANKNEITNNKTATE